MPKQSTAPSSRANPAVTDTVCSADYKPIGDTLIPAIGLGTWNFTGTPLALRAGIEAGATFIDTAEEYGTEEIVGEAIRGIRNRVFVASKVSPNHFKYSSVLQAADASLRRLKTDYIDLYHLHRPNYIVPISETMAALEELVRVGKVRMIGVSNFSVTQFRRAQQTLSRCRIVSNQLRYSITERTIEPEIGRYYRQTGITVVAFTPLGRGIENLNAADPDGVLKSVASEVGRTVAQVALNWCIAQDGVVAIPKANSRERIIENCGGMGWRLSPDQIDRLTRSIRFRRRSGLEISARSALRAALQYLRCDKGF